MAKRRVPWFNKPNQFVEIEPDATIGAVVGVNLYWPDGSLVTEADLAGETADDTEEVINQVYLTSWASVLSKPQNIIEAAALTGAGVIVRQVTGDWVVRTIEGTAGNIVVTNGTGDAGNPIINLATVADSGTGALLAITRDGFGRVTGTRAVTPADLPALDLMDSTFIDLEYVLGDLTASLSATGTPSDETVLRGDNAFAKGVTQDWSAGALALTNTSYSSNDSFAFYGEMNVVDAGTQMSGTHIFLNAGGGGGTWGVSGLIGGSQGRQYTISNDATSLTPVEVIHRGATQPEDDIVTPGGVTYNIAPGSSITIRWVYDTSLADPGYWVFCAISSAPPPLSHRVDDIVATAGNNRFQFDKAPYMDIVALYEDGLRLPQTDYSGTGLYRYLDTPAAGGEVFTADYWTAEAGVVGATVMATVTPVTVTNDAPDGGLSIPYSHMYGATGGDGGPYTFSSTGTLPDGLVLDTDGELHGTPTDDTGSPFAFDVYAEDSSAEVSAPFPQSVAITASDPFFADNVFLLPLEGTDGSTTITDVMGGTWTAFGDAQIDTSNPDYPDGALLLDGVGDYATSGTIAGLALGTGPFTLEMYVTFNSNANQYAFDTISGNQMVLGIVLGGFCYYDPATGGGAMYTGPNATPYIGQRVHLAVSCDGAGVHRAFLDGVQWGTTTVTPHNKTDTVAVIGRFDPSANNYVDGHVSWVRLTAECRYTANFTPPAVPLPTS
jgi:hypothetical protein